jgi:hypothetical protein
MIFNTQALVLTSLFVSQGLATCFAPEPDRRICYSDPGATPQNVNLKEVEFTAKYLRFYASQKVNPSFFTMKVADADNCAEWVVTTKGGTMIIAKLVGEQDASIAFDDLANTIDGGDKAKADQKSMALLGCGTAGGQMGVIANGTNPLYQSKNFLGGGFTNKGIIIKVVRNPDVSSGKGPVLVRTIVA